MKRLQGIFALATTVILLLGISACSARTNDTQTDATESSAQQDGSDSSDSDEDNATSNDSSSSTMSDTFWDRQIGENVPFADITFIYELCEVEEYSYYNLYECDWPTSMSAELFGGVSIARGEIDDPDVIANCWLDLVEMRMRISESKPDDEESGSQSVTFYWDDGRIQTYTFKGTWSFVHDGMLYPIFEHLNTDGEDFSGPVPMPIPNDRYPGTYFDVIARLAGKSKSGDPLIIVTYDSRVSVKYEDNSFVWDADNDGRSDTLLVKQVEGDDGSVTGISLVGAWGSSLFCSIEGAQRLIKVVVTDNGEENNALITYETIGDGETKRCRIEYVDDELVVTYL